MAIEQARRYLVERVGNDSKSRKGRKCGVGKNLIEDLDGEAKLRLDLLSPVPGCDKIEARVIISAFPRRLHA